MSTKTETPHRGESGEASKVDFGQFEHTSDGTYRQIKLHPMGRRAVDNLRHELAQLSDLDQTEQSAIRACEFLLKNY